jgi:hypothetical protein
MDINDLITEGKKFYFIDSEFSNDINDAPNYAKWKEKCKRFLNLKFKNDKYIENFEKNCAFYDNSHTHNELIGIIEAFRDMPSIIQKPTSKSKSGQSTVVNVHQNQQQEQSQSQEIAIHIFLEAIKDELKGKQLKEIKAIITEEPEPEKAKSKVIEKLKSFGENVLSNIVANVITNPTIWGGFM